MIGAKKRNVEDLGARACVRSSCFSMLRSFGIRSCQWNDTLKCELQLVRCHFYASHRLGFEAGFQIAALWAYLLTSLLFSQRLLASAHAEEIPLQTAAAAPVESLEQAEAHALLNNQGVKAAFERWQAALEKIPQAEAFPDPRFSYTYYIENVETRVGPQEQALALQQTFPWQGKRGLRGDVAGAAAEAARYRYEQAKLNLLYEVRDAYYDLYYLKRAINITRENMQLLEALEKVAQTRYKAGGPMLPLIQLQTELGRLEDRVKALTALRPARVARLNAALNRPAGSSMPWPETIEVPQQTLNEENLRARLAAQSPLLKQHDTDARKFGYQADLAAKDRWPDVTLGMKYIDTGDALNSSAPGSGTDPVMATVSINLPVWRHKYEAAEAEAELKQRAAVSEKLNSRNILNARLDMVLFKYRDAGRKINLYRDTLIPKAEQSLRVAQQAFEGGKTDFLSLIDAERMLLEFELQYEKARTERARRLAEIEKLVGAEIKTAQKAQTTGEK